MQGFRKIILFPLLVISQLTISGQAKNLFPFKRCSVKTINFEQGLLNNATTNILTDVLGFTWISTRTGMQRFNGYTLENIMPVVNKDTININYPVFFFGLRNGSIWISYNQGVLAYAPLTNSFSKVISYKSTRNSYYSLIPLQETKEGIWCMQEKKGIVIYSQQGIIKKVLPFFNPTYSDSILQSRDLLFNTISTGNHTFIFIHNLRNQILQINTRTHQLNYINSGPGYIYGLCCNQNNIYLLSPKGLSCLNIGIGKIVKTILFKTFTNENISKGSMVLIDNNQLLVSVNNHLYEFDTSCIYHKEFTTLTRNPVVSTGEIQITYADKFKRIWLLTNDDIKRIQNVNIPFEHFLYPHEKNNFVRSLYYDEQKHVLLAGCYNGGIQLYDTLANPLWPKPLITTGVNYIIAIEKLTNDDYLIETLGKGWYLLNLPAKQLRPFSISMAIESELHSHSINFDNNVQRINDSTVFIATSKNVSRCVFNKATLKSVRSLFSFTGNTANFIDCFFYTSTKTLWGGTNSGLLLRFDKNKILQTINTPGNYLIRCITEDSKQNIWVGTDKGLYVYSCDGRLIRKVTRETGLLNDCIYALLPANNNAAVFASSNLGISYISADGVFNNYSKELGLQENEFNTGSAIKTLSGKFYFGGVNGVNAFYPAALNVIRDTPIINITRLVVNDSLYNSSAGIWKGDSILLQYYQNHLQFDLAAMGLFDNNEYLYKYRLKGFEESWQSTHQPTGIKYTLVPGQYTFEIICYPILSTNSITKKIVIIIYSPWWQTWWFRVAIGIIALTMIVLILQQYNRRKFLQKIRTLQMQQEIQHERERISRDLHDNLGIYAASIASNIDHVKITEKDIVSKKALQELHSNSQSIVSQLGDTIWALKKDAQSLTAISDRLKVFLQKIQLSYPDILINISEQIIIDRVLPASQAFHLLQIVQEAVINAVRHSHCKCLKLSVEVNEQWKISIEDNGKGMPQERNISGEGNGLSNMILRAKEAGWKIEWQQNDPTGTKVEITSADTN